GVGVACYTQGSGIGPYEGATVRVDPSGQVFVYIGVTAQGQGHATTLAQIAADALGVRFEDVMVVAGDAQVHPFGMGTGGSRVAANAGPAVLRTAREVREIRLLAYAVVHDSGRPINPTIVEAQLLGGAVQGIGAGLWEELVYDGQGQLVTGSLMDYGIPKADQLPLIAAFPVAHLDHPSVINELGIKGVGESGAIPGAAAIAN